MTCALPESVCTELVAEGFARYPGLRNRSSEVVAGLQVLAVSADVVSLAVTLPAMRAVAERLLAWARGAQRQTIELKVGDAVKIRLRLPAGMQYDETWAVETAAKLMDVLASSNNRGLPR